MAEGLLVDLGGVKVRLVLDDSSVKPAIVKSERDLSASAKRLEKTFSTIGKGIGLAVGLAAAAVTAALTASLRHADALNKTSQKIGIAVEDLSRLEYAAKLSDVSIDSLSTSVARLNRNLSDASKDGGSEIAKKFDSLGIAVLDANGKMRETDDIVSDLADRFSRMEDGPQKTALAMELLGRSGAELIPLLNSGRQGLKDFGDEADRVGYTISSKTAAAAEKFNDNVERINLAVQGIANKIAGEALPSLNDLAEGIEDPDFAEGVAWLAKTIIDGLNAIVKAVTFTTNMIRSFRDEFAPTQKKSDDGLVERSKKLIELQKEYKAVITDSQRRLDEGGFSTLFGVNEKTLADQIVTYTNKIADARREAVDIFKEIDRRATGELTSPTVTVPGTKDNEEDDPFVPGNSGNKEDPLKARLEAVQESLRSELQATQFAHEAQQTELETFLEKGLITQQEYNDLFARAEEEHWENMKNIRQSGLSDLEKFTQMSYMDQAKTIFGELESVTAGVKDHNDVLFNINKAAAVANAVINTYEGVSKSLATYPMPIAAIMAGIHAAAGFAQVSSILATSRNSKGGGVSGVGGGAAAAASAQAPQAGPRDNQTLHVQGLDPMKLFKGDNVRDLANRLLEYQKDGGMVVFSEDGN